MIATCLSISKAGIRAALRHDWMRNVKYSSLPGGSQRNLHWVRQIAIVGADSLRDARVLFMGLPVLDTIELSATSLPRWAEYARTALGMIPDALH